jgi:hypothetical protein
LHGFATIRTDRKDLILVADSVARERKQLTIRRPLRVRRRLFTACKLKSLAARCIYQPDLGYKSILLPIGFATFAVGRDPPAETLDV